LGGDGKGWEEGGRNDPNIVCTYEYNKKRKRTTALAGCQWLTPVILPTQEAEIRRMAVQSQPGQIVP
jgi:hypothetical protein